MKVLWVCDMVLPHLCDELGFKRTVIGGWINGMLDFIHRNTDIKMGICCPIKCRERMKDGIINKEQYYSFQMILEEDINCNQKERFIEIINDFSPDIIHIWGTEYLHTYNMLCAAEKTGMLRKTIVSIQGLISSVMKHYYDGIEYDNYGTIEKMQELNSKEKIRSSYEIKAIKKCINISGRTEWDRVSTMQINPKVNYWHIGEILRNVFYEEKGRWTVQQCNRHSIFLSRVYCPIKGLHYFFEAFQYVLKRFPDAIVKIAGDNIMESDNEYGRYLKRKAIELKIEEKIIFLGNISAEQMCREYASANVFVCASTVENSSNSICEAMIVGTPVIGSFVGGIPDLISHKSDGFLYPCNEPEMLSYYIERVFEDDALVTEFSRKGVQTISDKVDREKNGNVLIDIYNKMLNM